MDDDGIGGISYVYIRYHARYDTVKILLVSFGKWIIIELKLYK